MKRAYFITATGTDLGKTFVAAGIVRACRARGMAVSAVKPVMSGYDPERIAASDAGTLLAALGRAPTRDAVAAISPWRFLAPLSPDRAAALEGRAIDVDALLAWCRGQLADHDGLLLIEGIGGAMVPLDPKHTVRELIAALGLPTLLVAGSYLGALSHTLTALAALREAGVVPTAIVVNAGAESTVSLGDTLASLLPHAGGVPLFALGRDDTPGIGRLTEFLLGNGP